MPGENEALLEIALQRRVAELQKQIDDMRLLGTTDGFIKAWFALLPEHATHKAAFETLNDRYYDYWGEYRYADYDSFRRRKKEFLKKQT